jgi:hypothetical protein
LCYQALYFHGVAGSGANRLGMEGQLILFSRTSRLGRLPGIWLFFPLSSPEDKKKDQKSQR